MERVLLMRLGQTSLHLPGLSLPFLTFEQSRMQASKIDKRQGLLEHTSILFYVKEAPPGEGWGLIGARTRLFSALGLKA
jgi:hypothetical protein